MRPNKINYDHTHVSHYDQFLDLKEEWEDLYRDATFKPHYLSFEFVDLWYRCFAAPDRVRVYRVMEDGRVIALLPLVLERKKGVRIISSLTNEHCMHSGPLVRKGYEAAFSDKMLQALYQDQSSWDILQDSFSYSFSPFPGLFPDEMINKYKGHWYRMTGRTYAINLDLSYDDYWKNYLSNNTRHNFSQRMKKCKKQGTYAVRFFQGKEAIAHWSLFLDIEDSGWKGESGSSLKRLDVNYQNYYEGLLSILAERGELRLYFFELNGTPIAGLFGYMENNIFHDWKIGYLKEYQEYAPSHMLFLECLKQYIETRPEIKKFHMFPGEFGYKSRLVKDNPDCYLDTFLFSRTLRGMACYHYLRLKRQLS